MSTYNKNIQIGYELLLYFSLSLSLSPCLYIYIYIYVFIYLFIHLLFVDGVRQGLQKIARLLLHLVSKCSCGALLDLARCASSLRWCVVFYFCFCMRYNSGSSNQPCFFPLGVLACLCLRRPIGMRARSACAPESGTTLGRLDAGLYFAFVYKLATW